MKKILSSTVVFCITLSALAADQSVKLSDVHLCCTSCVKGVQTIVGKIPGVTTAVDKDAGTVSLTGPDKATLQKTVDSLIAGGFFGKSSDTGITVANNTGAKGEKVQSLKVDGIHICCGSCVTAINDAMETVPGVKANTAKKGETSFTITGDFNDKDIFAALQKEGLTGHVGK